jgi:hypothetical protein
MALDYHRLLAKTGMDDTGESATMNDKLRRATPIAVSALALGISSVSVQAPATK